MGLEQRSFGRAAISLNVRLTEESSDIGIDFGASNLSEGGIFVKSSLLWEPGQIFRISFVLPGAEKEINVRGVVARSDDKYSLFAERDLSVPGMGIKFLDLSAEDRQMIKEFVSKREL